MRYHVGVGPDHPIYFVSHADAEEFCRGMTESERTAGQLAAGWEYRLPTEAQWEYACRAGQIPPRRSATAWERRGELRRYASVQRCSPRAVLAGNDTRRPLPRQRLGLHDMLGNVWEWCRDGYPMFGVGEISARSPHARIRLIFRGFSRSSARFSGIA